MSRYKFSSAQRYAIFLTHKMRCYLCRSPLDLASMTVDHVVPESLLLNPSLFHDVKLALGLPENFEINSFENWMPACGPCNVKKAAENFNPSPLIQVELQRLVDKAQDARRIVESIVSRREISMALNVLERALEGQGSLEELTREKLESLLRFAMERDLVTNGQPLRLTHSFQLAATSVENARDWGATHWSMPPPKPGEPTLVVLLRAERGQCVECDLLQEVYQPINQEGGGDPICRACLAGLNWMPPVILGELPTHVTSSAQA